MKILQPQNLAQFNFGQAINFQGEAVQGITNLRWESDKDGEFAQGLTATVSTLSVGTHTITLKGNVGSPAGIEVLSAPIQIGIKNLIEFKVLEISFLKDPVSLPPPPASILSKNIKATIANNTLGNRNKIYDRVKEFVPKNTPPGAGKLLEPPQWFAEISENNSLVQVKNYPASFVRSGDSKFINSKIEISCNIKNISNFPAGNIFVSVTATFKNLKTKDSKTIHFTSSSPQPLNFAANSPKNDVKFLSENIPDTVGKWDVTLEWNFKQGDTPVGLPQTTPGGGDFHRIYTSWKKSEEIGNFSSNPKAEIIRENQGHPFAYLEVIDFSTDFSPQTAVSDYLFIKKLFENFQSSSVFKYDLAVNQGSPPPFHPLEFLLSNKMESCGGLSEFFEALAGVQGVYIEAMQWDPPVPFSYYRTKKIKALNAANKIWEFTNHAFNIQRFPGSFPNGIIFDGSFNTIFKDPAPAQFDPRSYEEELFTHFGKDISYNFIQKLFGFKDYIEWVPNDLSLFQSQPK